MSERQPVRLQLSRAKGFNLQAASMAVNGLSAVNVARPSRFGNPFRVGFDGTAEECVRRFEGWLLPINHRDGTVTRYMESQAAVADIERSLCGRNLACWCALDTPCHGDVLLRLANIKCEAA